MNKNGVGVPQQRGSRVRKLGCSRISLEQDRKSTRLSHSQISYAVFCLKKKKKEHTWSELRRQVAIVAEALRALVVRSGDRIAAYLPNCTPASLWIVAASLHYETSSSCVPH